MGVRDSTDTHTHKHTHTQTHRYTHTHTHTPTHIHAHAHTHTHKRSLSLCVCFSRARRTPSAKRQFSEMWVRGRTTALRPTTARVTVAPACTHAPSHKMAPSRVAPSSTYTHTQIEAHTHIYIHTHTHTRQGRWACECAISADAPTRGVGAGPSLTHSRAYQCDSRGPGQTERCACVRPPLCHGPE
jgi:hypothetical protein